MSLTNVSCASINEVTTDIKLQKFFDEEEGDMIVMEFCRDLMTNVMDEIQSKILRDQAQNFVVKCAMEAIRKAIRINYNFHNVSYSDTGTDSWKPDEQCEPSPADSWAAYRAPVIYDRESDKQFEEQQEENSEGAEGKEPENFDDICTSRKPTISPTTSSQDILSIIDYLEDILTSSSDDEIDTSALIDTIPLLSNHSGIMSAKLSARLSLFSGKAVPSDSTLQPRFSEQEKYMSSTFSKTTLGTDTGLCVPHIANQPVNNVVKETPDIEDYTLVKLEKRKIKVMRKPSTGVLPRRRSDTKLKMANIVKECSREKLRERKKRNPT